MDTVVLRWSDLWLDGGRGELTHSHADPTQAELARRSVLVGGQILNVIAL